MLNLPDVARAVRELYDAAAASVALLEEPGEELVFVAADGAGADLVVGMRLPVSRGLAGFAVVTGQPLAVADVSTDRRFDRATAESTDYMPRTVLAAPLALPDGEVLGVLEVLDPASDSPRIGPHRGSGAELAVLTLVAGLVAAALPREESGPAQPLDLARALVEALSLEGRAAGR